MTNKKLTDKEIKIQAYRDFADRLINCNKVRIMDFCNETYFTSAVLVEDIETTLMEMVSEVK